MRRHARVPQLEAAGLRSPVVNGTTHRTAMTVCREVLPWNLAQGWAHDPEGDAAGAPPSGAGTRDDASPIDDLIDTSAHELLDGDDPVAAET
jgi:hypothetical protein